MQFKQHVLGGFRTGKTRHHASQHANRLGTASWHSCYAGTVAKSFVPWQLSAKIHCNGGHLSQPQEHGCFINTRADLADVVSIPETR